jgi:putative ABC transport system ATP-binding protein
MLLDIQDLAFVRGRAGQSFRVELPHLAIAPGELVALTGESGSGKSTALELLGLVSRPLPGARYRVLVDEGAEDVVSLWRRNDLRRLARLRATAIGFVLQTGGLLPYLSVADSLTVNRQLAGLVKRDAHVDMLIDALEIGRLLSMKPAELSVGQYQRACIACALAHAPRLLLADEPTSALDPRLGGRVMALMLELASRLGIAVVLATHARDSVRDLSLRELQAAPLGAGDGCRFEEAPS